MMSTSGRASAFLLFESRPILEATLGAPMSLRMPLAIVTVGFTWSPQARPRGGGQEGLQQHAQDDEEHLQEHTADDEKCRAPQCALLLPIRNSRRREGRRTAQTPVGRAADGKKNLAQHDDGIIAVRPSLPGPRHRSCPPGEVRGEAGEAVPRRRKPSRRRGAPSWRPRTPKLHAGARRQRHEAPSWAATVAAGLPELPAAPSAPQYRSPHLDFRRLPRDPCRERVYSRRPARRPRRRAQARQRWPARPRRRPEASPSPLQGSPRKRPRCAQPLRNQQPPEIRFQDRPRHAKRPGRRHERRRRLRGAQKRQAPPRVPCPTSWGGSLDARGPGSCGGAPARRALARAPPGPGAPLLCASAAAAGPEWWSRAAPPSRGWRRRARREEEPEGSGRGAAWRGDRKFRLEPGNSYGERGIFVRANRDIFPGANGEFFVGRTGKSSRAEPGNFREFHREIFPGPRTGNCFG